MKETMRKTFPVMLIAVLTAVMLSGCNVKVSTEDDPEAVNLNINGLPSDENVAGLKEGTEEETKALTDLEEDEEETEILINRSELSVFDNVEGTIYVTGHRSPDSDTVGSSIGLAALLNELGYDAKAVVLGDINNETKYILEQAGIEKPEILETVSGLNIALVDHSDYEHSAEGLGDAYIVAIIDHHGDGSVKTGNQLLYEAKALGATATIVWEKYRDYGVEPDKEAACAMIGSIFSDTHKLEYATTTFADEEAVRDLADVAQITDLDGFYQGMREAALSYDGKTDEEILFSDYKEYEAEGTHYAIGCIEAVDTKRAEDLAERMKDILQTVAESKGMDMIFVQIGVNEGDVSYTYLVPSNDKAEDVLRDAFGEGMDFDGISYVLSPSISRKTVLVPEIEDSLRSIGRK